MDFYKKKHRYSVDSTKKPPKSNFISSAYPTNENRYKYLKEKDWEEMIKNLNQRLINEEYLKSSYENIARERSIEIGALKQEIANLDASLKEANKKIDEMKLMQRNTDTAMARIIEDGKLKLKTSELEAAQSKERNKELEELLKSHYDQNLTLFNENKELRKKLEENNSHYLEEKSELIEKIKELELSNMIAQKRIEQYINSECRSASPFTSCRRKAKRESITELKSEIEKLKLKCQNEVTNNNLLRDIIKSNVERKKEPETIEDRLKSSEMKIKELESLVLSSQFLSQEEDRSHLASTGSLLRKNVRSSLSPTQSPRNSFYKTRKPVYSKPKNSMK
ncbi:unnamed protein product [Blepharisma stoltei]|uniref:Uncharacterized protein n=1 Tax=Blepharisma stoltei TaxID=1481888 RepID=A0AAU9JHL4_9CILI|nr:unnamed protein product [Blepharisma stoltei]